jgi:hypothetical protein
MVGEWDAQHNQLIIAAQRDSWGFGAALDSNLFMQLTMEYFWSISVFS